MSGGGYRAATFHLGTLSFLNNIHVGKEKTLLDCVSVMSTVSGGTITGLRYMLALAKKEEVDGMIKNLYDFLFHEDLVEDAFANIEKGRTDNGTSLIKLMASIYDEKLFNGAVMGDLMDRVDDIPVKHFSANATDFSNGLPFRFQVTETRMTEKTRSAFGIFGNNEHRLGQDIARQITLGEALACSSCFPSGFEPMVFPDDFKVSQKDNAARIDSFGSMDGGIVDNQGIEPILLAEERIRKSEKDRTDKALELVIVSDVASPYLKGYSPNQPICRVAHEGVPVDTIREQRIGTDGRDCCDTFRTELFQKHRFPEYPGERFIGEGAVFFPMELESKGVYFNEVLYLCDYREDGLTKAGRKMRILNPLGGMFNSKTYMHPRLPMKTRIKKGILYACYARFAKVSFFKLMRENPYKFLTFFTIVPGSLLAAYWKHKHL